VVGMVRMAEARIRSAGRPAIVVRMPGNGTGDLNAEAGTLNGAITRALDAGAPSVDLIGYSAGGVVVLLWARRDDGAGFDPLKGYRGNPLDHAAPCHNAR